MVIAFDLCISTFFIIGTYVLLKNQEKCYNELMEISLYNRTNNYFNFIKIDNAYFASLLLLMMISLVHLIYNFSFNLIKNYTWIFEIATIIVKYTNISLLMIYLLALLTVFIALVLDSAIIYCLIVYILTQFKMIIAENSGYNENFLACISYSQLFILMAIPHIEVNFLDGQMNFIISWSCYGITCRN
jgi:hypothetical protein